MTGWCLVAIEKSPQYGIWNAMQAGGGTNSQFLRDSCGLSRAERGQYRSGGSCKARDRVRHVVKGGKRLVGMLGYDGE